MLSYSWYCVRTNVSYGPSMHGKPERRLAAETKQKKKEKKKTASHTSLKLKCVSACSVQHYRYKMLGFSGPLHIKYRAAEGK